MSGEYQLRKDVDKIIDDIYDIDYNTLKVVKFKENSPLKEIGVHVDDEGNYIDVGTLDTILESLGLMDIDERVRELVIEGGGDLSNYYTKIEINTILSSYVTSATLEDYALKSELFSGSYNDLSDKPNIPSKTSDLTNDGENGTDTYVENGDLSNVATSGSYNDLIDTPTIPTNNVFYGTCNTSSDSQVKEVTVSNWQWNSGNILFVWFTYPSLYNGTSKIKIGSISMDIYTSYFNGVNPQSTQYLWGTGEVVGFVFNGSKMIMLDGYTASTSFYGMTILEDSVSSTSTTKSATPNSVKQAYDLANGKAPKSHSSSATTYGVGTTSNYGHNKIRDNLTASTLTDGESLSAHQGYVLKGLIDDLEDAMADFDASNIDFEPSSNIWGEYVQVVNTVATGLNVLKEISNALNTAIIGKQDIGDCVTSIELVPKSSDATGTIRLYYGDEI